MKAFRFGFLLLLLGAAGFLFSCASSQTPSTQAPAAKAGGKNVIRIGSPFKAGSIVVDAAEKFKELMEKGSAGKWAVEVQAGKDSEENINDWNSQGKIEMQSNGHRALEIFAPQYFFFNAPYVMKDLDHLMRVWNGKLGNAAREQTIKNGNVMYLGIISRGLRQTTSRKPLYTPADAYGMKLRLPTVKTWIAVWKEIGADPIPIPLPDLFKSLKDGKADASEGDLPQIVGFKLDQAQSHLTMTNHLVQTAGMMINKKFFDGLPKQDQQLILKASKDACQWANEKMKKDETKLLLELQRKGMQVVIPDADLFRAKGKPAVEGLFKTEWPVTTWSEVLAQ
jgi:tripartite ATP-independent transporter DctP family solute receptor